MASLAGFGRAMGALGEGMSGGLLKGQLTNIELAQKEKDNAFKERSLGIQERGVAAQEKSAGALDAYRQAQVQSGLNEQAFKEYHDVAKMAIDMAKAGNYQGSQDLYNTVAKKHGHPEITGWQDMGQDEYSFHVSDGSIITGNKKTGQLEVRQNPNAGKVQPQMKETVGPDGKPTFAMVSPEGVKPIPGATPYHKEGKDQSFQQEKQLREEFTKATKDFVTIRNAYSTIQKSATLGSAAGDMALIFGLMKMYDPNSVVRETEYATAENARGVPDSIANSWNKLLNGERLTEGQRAEFAATAQHLYNVHEGYYNRSSEQFGGLADQYGVNRGNVVSDLSAMNPGQSQPLPGSQPGATSSASSGTPGRIRYDASGNQVGAPAGGTPQAQPVSSGKAGGKIGAQYSTPDAVRQAYQNGELTKETAAALLRKFGFQ
jgi:hypothetical protein